MFIFWLVLGEYLFSLVDSVQLYINATLFKHLIKLQLDINIYFKLNYELSDFVIESSDVSLIFFFKLFGFSLNLMNDMTLIRQNEHHLWRGQLQILVSQVKNDLFLDVFEKHQINIQSHCLCLTNNRAIPNSKMCDN